MVKVVWTDAALFDLDEIGDYIAKDSVRYAQLTIKKLFESIDILSVNNCARLLGNTYDFSEFD